MLFCLKLRKDMLLHVVCKHILDWLTTNEQTKLYRAFVYMLKQGLHIAVTQWNIWTDNNYGMSLKISLVISLWPVLCWRKLTVVLICFFRWLCSWYWFNHQIKLPFWVNPESSLWNFLYICIRMESSSSNAVGAFMANNEVHVLDIAQIQIGSPPTLTWCCCRWNRENVVIWLWGHSLIVLSTSCRIPQRCCQKLLPRVTKGPNLLF